MSESESQMFVVKISTPLSNTPLFVRINEQNQSIDRIFCQAIETLKISGKTFESSQLEQLFKTHQLFNNGKVVEKGSLFSELTRKAQAVGSNAVQIADIDLISSHHGGLDLSFFKEECRVCKQLTKGYCIGTHRNEKGLVCCKKVSNGSKYRSVLRSKRQA